MARQSMKRLWLLARLRLANMLLKAAAWLLGTALVLGFAGRDRSGDTMRRYAPSFIKRQPPSGVGIALIPRAATFQPPWV